MEPTLILPAALAVWFVLAYSVLLGRSWRRLASHYRSPRKPPRESVSRFQSGMIGVEPFRFSLHLAPTSRGLHLWVALPFRVAHPPLLIPWEALFNRRPSPIQFRQRHLAFEVPVAAHEAVTLHLPRRFIEEAAAAGHPVPAGRAPG